MTPWERQLAISLYSWEFSQMPNELSVLDSTNGELILILTLLFSGELAPKDAHRYQNQT